MDTYSPVNQYPHLISMLNTSGLTYNVTNANTAPVVAVTGTDASSIVFTFTANRLLTSITS